MIDGTAKPSGASPGQAGGRDATRTAARGQRPTKALFLLLPLSLLVLAALFFFPLSGCGGHVATEYGSRQAIHEGDESINGTGVLSELFVLAGHRVSTATRLSPRLRNSADVIVWFIQDFSPPSQAAGDSLEAWLRAEEGRTLIVVGRDYDAEPLYWSKVLPQANAQQQPIASSKGALATTRFAGERAPTAPQPEDWRWFALDRSPNLLRRGVTTLTGDWAAGIDPTKAEIELYGRIKSKEPQDEILLETPGDVLAFGRWYGAGYFFGGQWSGASQLIVVANGSFLLNMPLVNREHRKLAAALLDEMGEEQRVFFLETGGNAEVLAEDPALPRVPTSTMYFDVPRLQNLLWHLAVLTLIVCFGLFAIHGRPRRAPRPPPSDFGRHAEALGDLLASTRDAAYAQARLSQYRSSIRGDGGKKRRQK